jgi:peptidyl-prolyl cis-trans isomerase A (cyclophilin A)
MLSPSSKADQNEIVLQTRLGRVIIALDEARAPETSRFVRGLVREGRFDGTSFYRAGAASGSIDRTGFVEGGLLDRFVMADASASLAASGLPVLEALETTDLSGLRHVRGSVSLARDVLDTGVGIPDMVIYLEESPEADAGGAFSPDGRGYPVFGSVTEGLEIFDQLALMPRDGKTWVPFLEGQILSEPLTIEAASVR